MKNAEYEQKLLRRLQKFKLAIQRYQEHQVGLIQQKSKDEQQFQRNKILNQSREKDQDHFHKKQKTLQTQVKIMKSRKINESRMTKMKLRHQFIQRIKQQVKNTLTQKLRDDRIYKDLLKQLIIQGLIKMLEENVQIKCLKKDVSLVKEIAFQSEIQFNKTSTVQTKITVNQRQNLSDSDIGGIYVTSNKGRIVCNNTLAARLEHSMQNLLPDIRQTLFYHEQSAPKLI